MYSLLGLHYIPKRRETAVDIPFCTPNLELYLYVNEIQINWKMKAKEFRRENKK